MTLPHYSKLAFAVAPPVRDYIEARLDAAVEEAKKRELQLRQVIVAQNARIDDLTNEARALIAELNRATGRQRGTP